jgi:hypothetical protein
VDWANSSGSPTFDSVRFYIESHKVEMSAAQAKENICPADVVVVDTPELAGYDSLIMKEENNDGE